MSDDANYLSYIRDSIQLLEERAAFGFDVFLHDDILQDAVLRRLETLADACGQLSPELKSRHPEILWRDIIDFRNRVAHGYLHVDLEIVWRIIVIDIPALKVVVAEELDVLGQS